MQFAFVRWLFCVFAALITRVVEALSLAASMCRWLERVMGGGGGGGGGFFCSNIKSND